MKMKSIISFMIIIQAIINGVNLTTANTSTGKDRYVCRGGDFKSDTIRKNRNLALDKLVGLLKNSVYHGFHHTNAGDKPEEQVSATYLCPPTIQKELCKCGFNQTVKYLLSSCPKQSEGVAWQKYARFTIMVRYSTGRKILSVLDDWAWYSFPYPDNVKAIALEKTMDSLASKLKEQAAGGDGLKKYATGSAKYDGEENTLFVAVQCTPDLTKGDCIKCLSKASNEIRNCCTKKPLFEGRVFSTNCFIWYAHVSFLDIPKKFLDEFCG